MNYQQLRTQIESSDTFDLLSVLSAVPADAIREFNGSEALLVFDAEATWNDTDRSVSFTLTEIRSLIHNLTSSIALRETPAGFSVQVEVACPPLWRFPSSFPSTQGSHLDFLLFLDGKFSFSWSPEDANEELPSFTFNGTPAFREALAAFTAGGLQFTAFSGRIRIRDRFPDFFLQSELMLPAIFARGFLDHEAIQLGISSAPPNPPTGTASSQEKPALQANPRRARPSIASAAPSLWDQQITEPKPSIVYHLRTTFLIRVKDREPLRLPARAMASSPKNGFSLTLEMEELSDFALEELFGLFEGHTAQVPAMLNSVKPTDIVQLQRLQFNFRPNSSRFVDMIGFSLRLGPERGFHLPSEENSLVSMQDVQLNFQMLNPLSSNRSWFFTLGGGLHFSKADSPLELSAITESNGLKIEYITAETVADQPIGLRSTWTHFTGQEASHLPDLKIQDIMFNYGTEKGEFRLSGELDDVWELDWGGHQWSLGRLEFLLERNEEGEIGAELSGSGTMLDLEFNIFARHRPGSDTGWEFQGRLHDWFGAVNFTYVAFQLAEFFGFDPPHPDNYPQFYLDHLQIGFNTATGHFAFEAESIMENNFGELEAGLFADVLLQIEVNKDEAGKRKFRAGLTAHLNIAEQEFDVSIELGTGKQLLFAQWENEEGLNLLDLIRSFDPRHDLQAFEDRHVKSEIEGFLTLTAVCFEYEHERGGKHTVLVGLRTKAGLEGFLIGRYEDGWSFLFGVDYEVNSEAISELTGVPNEVLKPLDGIAFNAAGFVVATKDFNNFTLPSFPNLHNQDGSTREIQPFFSGQEISIHKGGCLFLNLDLGKSPAEENKAHQTLKENYSGPQLTAFVGFDADINSFALRVHLDHFHLETSREPNSQGQLDHGLTLRTVALSLTLPEFSLMVSGDFTFQLDHQAIRAKASLALDMDEFMVGVDIQGEHDPIRFMGIEGLYLDEFWALIGGVFEPPGIEFGVYGKMHWWDDLTTQSSFGIILEFVEEIPNPRFLEIINPKTDHAAMLNFLMGRRPEEVPSLGFDLEVNNLRLYWAEAELSLPNGRILQPGFGFSAEYRFFGHKAFLALQINFQHGIEGHAVMDRFDIGGLVHISGHSSAYTVNKRLNPETNLLEEVPNFPESKDDQFPLTGHPTTVIPAGGPAIHVNTRETPYLSIRLNISLFDLLRTNLDVDLTDEGFTFDFGLHAGPILGLHMPCTVGRDKGFSGAAVFHFGLDKEIPVPRLLKVFIIPLNTSVSATFAVNISSKGIPSLSLDVSADLFGLEINPDTIPISKNLQSITDLPAQGIASIERDFIASLGNLWDFLFHRDKWLREQRATTQKDKHNEHNTLVRDAIPEWKRLANAQKAAIDSVANGAKGEANQRAAMLAAAKSAFNNINSKADSYLQTCQRESTGILREALEVVENLHGRTAEVKGDPHHAIRKSKIQSLKLK